MAKVPLAQRLNVLFQINELFDKYCNTCPFSEYYNSGRHEKCNSDCSIGFQLQELGKQYAGCSWEDMSNRSSEYYHIDPVYCLKLLGEGHSYSYIAEYYGATETTIKRRIAGYKAKQRKEQQKTNEKAHSESNEILQLYNQGLPMLEISDILNIPYTKVLKIVKRYNWNSN